MTAPTVAVVGAITRDDIETPAAAAREELGGSAVYAALAAALLGPVQIVSVVGDDAPLWWLERMAGRGIDVSGVRVVPGATFHWGCRYRANLEDRDTLFVRPGVFDDTPIVAPRETAAVAHLFLSSSVAAQNRAAMAAYRDRRLTMLDTIEREIVQARAALLETIAEVDVVSINEAEARMLLGVEGPLARAEVATRTLAMLREWGAETLLLKHGPEGITLADAGGLRTVAAARAARVTDPTGAGDVFGGAALAALAAGASLEEAARWGSATASFVVEAFGAARLWEIDRADVERRVAALPAATPLPAAGSAVP